MDKGTECTRVRLVDFSMDFEMTDEELSSYFEAYAEDPNKIKLEYSDLYTQCRDQAYYPIQVQNDKKDYSTYYFFELSNDYWPKGEFKIQKILRIEIYASTPYKYKSIEYLEPDQLPDLLKKVRAFATNEVDQTEAPLPFFALFPSRAIDHHCFNYSELFSIAFFEYTPIRSGKLRINLSLRNTIPDSIRNAWIQIQNKIDNPIIVHVLDRDTLSHNYLPSIKDVRLNYFWLDGRNSEVLSSSNLSDLYIENEGKNSVIRIPSSLTNSIHLTCLTIVGKHKIKSLKIPEEVLKLPSLKTILIKDYSFNNDLELFESILTHFDIQKYDSEKLWLIKK